MAQLERLPNELFVELFQYLADVPLFYAFYGLNTRLNGLLSIHRQVYHLDLRSISKKELQILYEEHLHSLIHRVKSLYLSDDSPTLPLTLDRFIGLQSLTIDSIHCLSTLNCITLACRRLFSLRYISLLKCDFTDQTKFDHLIINLWHLPKLISCTIDHRSPYQLKLTNKTIINLTLQNLFLDNFRFDLSDLFHCTPSLRHLSISIIQRPTFSFIRSSLISLKISIRKSFDFPFKNFPNLTCLIVETHHLLLDGHDWKQIIVNYLPKLQIFQLKMEMKFSRPQQFDQLINSFRTPFWIDERQWFVQCDCFTCGISQFAILYTLPYAFEEFLLVNPHWSKSTARGQQHFDHVNTLTIIQTPSHMPNFVNLRHLKIDLPLANDSWSTFDQLISLEITFVDKSIYLPLQRLLDRSTRLHSICFGKSAEMETISRLKSTSVQRLDYLTKNIYKKYFNSEQCALLSHSALGRQCKGLLICVEQRRDIISLLKTMTNLRSLICQCKDDTRDETLIHWFRQYLPTTCSITRDEQHISNIRLRLE